MSNAMIAIMLLKTSLVAIENRINYPLEAFASRA
jgi:hypothetical protein